MSLTERQLAMRRTGITGTDIVALAGLSPYGRTPHDVWTSKVLGVEAFEESEAIELGLALEPIVIPRLARKVGLYPLRIDPEKLTMRHKRVAHHVATPDALFAATAVHDPEATAQVKVCGLHVAGEWGKAADGPDGVPEYVLVQDAWEMHVAGLPVSFVGALIGTEIRAYRIEATRDIAALVGALEEVADRFWTDHVIAKKPPTIDGSDGSERMVRALFPRSNGVVLRASDELEEVAQKYFEAKALGAAAEEQVSTYKQILQAACGEADGIVGRGWRLKYALRDAYEVTPKPYVVPAGRRFDMRLTDAKSKGCAA